MIIGRIRRLFASFREEEEEKEYSRKAFFNLLGFLGSCMIISVVAQKLSRQPSEMNLMLKMIQE